MTEPFAPRVYLGNLTASLTNTEVDLQDCTDVCLINTSTNNVYLRFDGQPAVVGQGFLLAPGADRTLRARTGNMTWIAQTGTAVVNVTGGHGL